MSDSTRIRVRYPDGEYELERLADGKVALWSLKGLRLSPYLSGDEELRKWNGGLKPVVLR